jgi:putative protein-disulfide isomerase
MNRQIVITVFTDPMMGLSWEMEPVMRKLETHYAGNIAFQKVMGLLVPDVYALTDPKELRISREYALKEYLKRLAAIYRSEEPIHGMPIPMENCVLFSTEETSSLPLNLAYYAVRETAPGEAEQFLYRLRYAVNVECRPAVKEAELARIAGLCGIPENEFLKSLHSQKTMNVFEQGQHFMHTIGVHSLPAWLIQYGERAVFLQSFSYEDFKKAIDQVSDGEIREQIPEKTAEAAEDLLEKHPLMSVIELREALDLSTNKEALAFAKILSEQNKAEVYDVPHGTFIRSLR